MTFITAYEKNRQALNTLAVEHSTVASALLTWLEQDQVADWQGTATDLLGLLVTATHSLVANGNHFPKSPNKLSGELKRIAPVLRNMGVVVEKSRVKGRSRINISNQQKVDELPLLSEMTNGVLPLEIPCEPMDHPNGTRMLCFRSLTPTEKAKLDMKTLNLLSVLADGRLGYHVRC